MKNVAIFCITVLLAACGQDGKLYLTDDDRGRQLIRQGASQQEQTRVMQRANKERTLRAEVVRLRQQEKTLRSAGEIQAADAVRLQALEAQYEIGKIVLQRQEEGQE